MPQNLEKQIGDYFQTKTITDGLAILSKCDNIHHIGLYITNYLSFLHPETIEYRYMRGLFAMKTEDYSLAFEIFSDLYSKNLNSCFHSDMQNSIFACIPKIQNNLIFYNKEIVRQICDRKESAIPILTFTITTCKRYDLFEQTMNSFLNCCLDIHRIDRWFCADDNSSPEDRAKMKEKYPFFEFYFKDLAEKGHAKSMNIILSHVNTPYIFHMEDDWKFFHK